MTRQSSSIDYEQVSRIVREAVEPLSAKVDALALDHATKTDLNTLRGELFARLDRTYTAEMVDAKFEAVRSQVATLQTQLEDARSEAKAASDSIVSNSERTLTRVALAISVGYTLVQALPHLVAGFK
jgi:outer membrane murein-binding lipoprotein Lpp